MSVSIPVISTLPDDKHAELEGLVAELGALIFSAGQTYLRQVEVIPEGSIFARANQLHARSMIANLQYLPANGRVSAISVPVETSSGLECYVVMPEEKMLAHPVRSNWNASSLLEEMLHSDLYGRLWDEHRYFQPTATQVPAYLVEITVVATKLIDEYMTNRRKAEYIGSMPIIEIDGIRQTGYPVTPPGELVEGLHHSRRKLSEMSTNHSAGQPANLTGDQLITWAWRWVFEPLTYDAGKRGWRFSVDETTKEAATVPFFAKHVRHYWMNVLAHLERARTSGLAAFPSAVSDVVDEIKSFLAYIGVTVQEDGTFLIRPSFNRWK